jgi:hypothetical protein
MHKDRPVEPVKVGVTTLEDDPGEMHDGQDLSWNRRPIEWRRLSYFVKWDCSEWG